MSKRRRYADWPCSSCGKHGTVDDGHMMLSRGSLKRGTMEVLPFCGPCAAKELSR